MPTDRIRYVDPDASGAANGLTRTDAYVSQVAAIAAEVANPDLVNDDVRLVLVCLSSAGSPDVGGHSSIASTWNTNYDTGHYILVVSDLGHGASATWDATKYRCETSAGTMSLFRDIIFDNIQIDATAVASSQGLFSLRDGGASHREFKKCYLRYSGTGGSSNYFAAFASSIGVHFSNNIFEGWPQTAIDNTRTTGVSYYYSNTFINCGTDISYANADLAVLKNNLSSGSTNGFVGTYAAGSDYNATDQVSLGYTVTGGGNSNDRASQTFTFDGSGYEPTVLDVGAYGHGVSLDTDPDYPVTDGIKGLPRAVPTTIGAADPDAAIVIRPEIDTVTPDPLVDGGNITITGTNMDLTDSLVLRSGSSESVQLTANQTPTQLGPNLLQMGDCPHTDINQTVFAAISNGIDPEHIAQVTYNPNANWNLTTISTPDLDAANSLLGFVENAPAVEDDQLLTPKLTRNGETLDVFPDGTFEIGGGTGTDYIDGIYFWSSVTGIRSGPVTIEISEGDIIAPPLTPGWSQFGTITKVGTEFPLYVSANPDTGLVAVGMEGTLTNDEVLITGIGNAYTSPATFPNGGPGLSCQNNVNDNIYALKPEYAPTPEIYVLAGATGSWSLAVTPLGGTYSLDVHSASNTLYTITDNSGSKVYQFDNATGSGVELSSYPGANPLHLSVQESSGDLVVFDAYGSGTADFHTYNGTSWSSEIDAFNEIPIGQVDNILSFSVTNDGTMYLVVLNGNTETHHFFVRPAGETDWTEIDTAGGPTGGVYGMEAYPDGSRVYVTDYNIYDESGTHQVWRYIPYTVSGDVDLDLDIITPILMPVTLPIIQQY